MTTRPGDQNIRIRQGRLTRVGPAPVVVPMRADGRCALDTCGVFIPHEQTPEAGGTGYCCTEHEREGGET